MTIQQNTREESCQRKHSRDLQTISFKYLEIISQSMHEETSPGSGGKYKKGQEESFMKDATMGLEIVPVPISQTSKFQNSIELFANYIDGVCLCRGIINHRQRSVSPI